MELRTRVLSPSPPGPALLGIALVRFVIWVRQVDDFLDALQGDR